MVYDCCLIDLASGLVHQKVKRAVHVTLGKLLLLLQVIGKHLWIHYDQTSLVNQRRKLVNS